MILPRATRTFRLHSTRSITRLALAAQCLTTALGTISYSVAAHGQEDTTRQEARERFDRGLRLFNAGDTSGALAEFQRVYDVTQHPLVLFNIGLVYQAMRQPVQSVDAFTKLLANPAGLDAERMNRVQKLLAEQKELIGYIRVVTEHANAAIEVDNVQVATTPLTQPIAVSSGNHVVALILPGYHPLRQQITVSGKSTAEFRGDLKPLEGRLAHLEIKANLAGASVLLNGQLFGKTPLPASLALAPGQHTVELKRDGYAPQKQSVTLGDGANGTLNFELAVDTASLASNSGYLELALTEDQAVIFVDSRPVGTYSQALQLPIGPHRLRVERANFFPYERDIDIPKGSSTQQRVELMPTPEYRADYVDSAVSQRNWGWVSVGAGALSMLGSTGFLVWNNSEVGSAEDKFNALAKRGRCIEQMEVSFDVCTVELAVTKQNLDDAQSLTKFGWIGLGVGAAAAGFGTFLLVDNDDPDRYEPKAESDVFGRLRATPVAWVTPGGWGAGVAGRF